MNQLRRLEHAVRSAGPPRPRISGVVTEATAGAYSVSGLSRFVALGDCVRLALGGHEQLAEVIRIDEARVAVKPFDVHASASLGTRVYLDGPARFALRVGTSHPGSTKAMMYVPAIAALRQASDRAVP